MISRRTIVAGAAGATALAATPSAFAAGRPVVVLSSFLG